MVIKSALILGSTGLTGRHLLDLLLADPEYESIITVVRQKTDRADGADGKLLEKVLDLNRLSEFPDLFRVQDVFCCLGTTIKKAGSQEAFRQVDFVYPLEAARLAEKSGAGSFYIITALGSDPHSLVFYNRVKGELESALRKIKIPAVHVFRPSLLLGHRGESRTGEEIGLKLTGMFGFLLSGPLLKLRPIRAEKVAQCMHKFSKSGQAGFFIHESDEMQRM